MARSLYPLSLVITLLGITAAATASENADQALPGGVSRSAVRFASKAHEALAKGNAKLALSLLGDRGLNLSKVDRQSIEGRAHFMLGDLAEARRKLRSAVRARPKFAADWFWLGRSYRAAGSYVLAASSYEKAHWHGLDSVELRHHWAETLLASGELIGKIAQHRWRRKDHRECPTPGTFAFDGLVLGPIPSSADRVVVAPKKSAIFQIHKALAADPSRDQSLLLAGEFWARINRHEQAVTLFERAAKHGEGEASAKCHNLWAKSLLSLGDYSGYLKHSRMHLQHAGEVDSAKLAACYDRAALESAGRGNLQRQIRYLTFAVELEARHGRLLLLARALQAAHRQVDAADYLRRALELEPNRNQRREIEQRLMTASVLASPAR